MLWVIIVNIFAVLALNRYNLKCDNAYVWINQKMFQQNQEWNPLYLHERWDSFYYIDIAKGGYHFTRERLLNVVFSLSIPS